MLMLRQRKHQAIKLDLIVVLFEIFVVELEIVNEHVEVVLAMDCMGG